MMNRDDNREPEKGFYSAGRRAAIEALRSDEKRATIEKIYLAFGVHGPQIAEIQTLARRYRVACAELDRRKFRELEQRALDGTDSQGVIVLAAQRKYQTIEEVLDGIPKGVQPLLLALDGLEDPHNIGAIIRSAEAAGVHALLLDQRRSQLTPAVYKTSAGAAEHLAIVKIGNLDQTLRDLREHHNLRILGLASEGVRTIYDADLTEPILLITGGEEKGLRHLIRERCDELLSIPLSGKTASLNASVATAVTLFEVMRQRRAL